ncbi:hypothetical protein ONO12_28290, partial [Salmonella enterica subsp. enterica serovar Montevideo]|nr:hypothetical protein [Salmonella enterica subsp. enterica serovar Montevideo]
LTDTETDSLFRVIRELKSQGRGIVYISHRMKEIFEICDDVTVCPRHLIGHELSPHLLVRAVNFHQAATPQLLLSALTCSECNV